MRFTKVSSCFSLIAVLIVMTAFMIGGCKKGEGSTELEVKIPPKKEKIHKVQTQHQKVIINLVGSLQSFQSTGIVPKAQGHVMELNFDKGDFVKGGTTLLVLDQSDYKLSLRSSLAQLLVAKTSKILTEVNIKNLEREYNRYKKLLDQKAIPESQFEKVQDGLELAKTQLKLSSAQIDLAQVGVDFANKKMGDTDVKAPYDGIISQKLISMGSYVQSMPPTVVAVIDQVDPIYIYAGLSELDINRIQQGIEAKISIKALDLETTAKVNDILGPLDPMSRTIQIRFKLENPDRKLLPGMTADIVIKGGTESRIAVPTEFIWRGDNGDAYVWKLGEDGKKVKTPIQIASEDDVETEISNGLMDGDTIVLVDKSEDVKLEYEKEARVEDPEGAKK